MGQGHGTGTWAGRAPRLRGAARVLTWRAAERVPSGSGAAASLSSKDGFPALRSCCKQSPSVIGTVAEIGGVGTSY